ncbi:hypothetical protein Ancab_037903 [Ancistrocladus abbreviatus]
MSIENEDLHFMAQAGETHIKMPERSKISYTREFLLSLSELEVCKKLPRGVDESLLSEFDVTSHGIQDRPRACGSSVLPVFRHNNYGSSSPTEGDMDNYSRGLHRWDSRSSGQSDTDTQSDRDSNSGRHYINQSKSSWQNQEHDGLLGSGSFPRPGYGAGSLGPRFRANDHYQLNRNNEPYHPPRPYKAVPHSRRETNDSYNDETFGSSEYTSRDRVEEEKKRRAEFELMRKEQQKVLQEKLKLNSDKPKDDPLSEIAVLMENPGDDTIPRKVDDHVVAPACHSDSGKLCTSSQPPPSRPLVPPGFTNSTWESNSGTKSVVHPNAVQIGRLELEDCHLDEKELADKMGFSEKQSENSSPSSGRDIKNADLSTVLEACQVCDVNSQSLEASNLPDVSEALGNGEITWLDTEKIGRHNIKVESTRSTSILEKLFGSALTGDNGATPKLIEDQETKIHDILSPHRFEFSKFAHWFLEEGKKQVEDVPSEKSNDLLLLIVGSGKGGSIISDTKAKLDIPPSESNVGMMASNLTSAAVGTAEQLYEKSKPDAVPSVLTCEDLEQSILSKISENNSNSPASELGYRASDMEVEQPKPDIDNCASQHLLSLLQKGMGPMSMTLSSILDKNSPAEQHDFESGAGSTGATHGNVSDGNAERFNSSGKTLTLETLFGTVFMKELQSVDAPVSAQRNLVGPARTDALETYGLQFPNSDDSLYPSAVDGIVSKRMSHDSSILASNGGKQIDLAKVEGYWSGFDECRTEVELSRLPTKVDPKSGDFDGPIEVQLPEEDSLITVSDPVNAQSSIVMPDFYAPEMESPSSSSKRPVNIAEKLAALGAAMKDERSVVGGKERPPFLHGPYDTVKSEITYQILQGQSSSAQFHPQQLNHGRASFHPVEFHPVHIDPQIRFMAPEAMIHHEAPNHHQFPANTILPPFQNPSAGLPKFDYPLHHPMLQQMHMSGNLAPHVPRGFPGGPPMPIHPTNNPAGYAQEQSPMQGFPFGQWQSNVGGVGMPLPGSEFGDMNNPPEALQRLLEMELRSNTKQPQLFAPGSHTRPMHEHELDAGFWYR